jgi:hypothetical protein
MNDDDGQAGEAEKKGVAESDPLFSYPNNLIDGAFAGDLGG